MSPDVDPAYAQVRLQAHHAARPDEVQWRRLFASRTLAHFLQTARQSSLARWVEELEPAHPREIEHALTARFAAYVGQVSRWLPRTWRAAVRATTELIQPGAGFDPQAWRSAWRATWPPMAAASMQAIMQLEDLCLDHRRRLVEAEPSVDSWTLRRGLEAALLRLFRRNHGEPVAVLAHLALVGIDLLRLRGAMIRRLVLPEVRSTVTWV